jgi:hypothetical protein
VRAIFEGGRMAGYIPLRPARNPATDCAPYYLPHVSCWRDGGPHLSTARHGTSAPYWLMADYPPGGNREYRTKQCRKGRELAALIHAAGSHCTDVKPAPADDHNSCRRLQIRYDG